MYERHLDTTGLKNEVAELVGKDLLCHCLPDEACHADILLAAAAAAVEKPNELKVDDGHADILPAAAVAAEEKPTELMVDDGLPVRVAVIPKAGGEQPRFVGPGLRVGHGRGAAAGPPTYRARGWAVMLGTVCGARSGRGHRTSHRQGLGLSPKRVETIGAWPGISYRHP